MVVHQHFINPSSKEADKMKDYLCRFTLRVDRELLDKFGYVAEYEGRTKNRELEQLMKHRVAEFEKEHGPIQLEEQEN